MASGPKGTNKILLAALGGAIVLIIAAIIILAITLGKTGNLNAIGATNPPPSSQPCSQNTIEAFYFTASSDQVNYNSIGTTDGFMNAMRTLQGQINKALSGSATTSAATTVASTAHAYLSHQTVFDAGSDFMPPVILGISQAANGSGVAVMASTVFTGVLPATQDIKNRLNSGGLTVIAITSGNQSNSMDANSQMCQHVGTQTGTTTTTSPQGTTTTTSPAPTCTPCSCSSTMAPSTTTASTNNSSQPAASTSPASTTTTTATTQTYPCMKDILILIDESGALQSYENYKAQVNFIGGMLITNWTVSPTQVEANPIVYDGNRTDFEEFGGFVYQNTDELRRVLIIIANDYYTNGSSSVAVGLQLATSTGVGGFRPSVPDVTLLFTASSDPVDINAAMPYAAMLKSNGSSLITIGLGPSINTTILSQLASGPNFAFSADNYANLLNNLALANQINNAICLMPPTTTPGPTTTSSTTTTTTGPTTPSTTTIKTTSTPPTTTTPTTTIPTTTTTTTTVTTTTRPLLPIYPCKKDILILMDNSMALLSSTNYQAQLDFISKTLITNWTVNMQQVEANPAIYSQNPADFDELGSFAFGDVPSLQGAIHSAYLFFFHDLPSITTGLQQSLQGGVTGWRTGVPRVTLLFSAQSLATDVSSAMPFAAQMKNNGDILITIGMGALVNMTVLSQLSSGTNFSFSASDYPSLPNNSALANQINLAICQTPPTTTPGPTTTTQSTTTTTTVPTTVPPSYPCKRDITLMMDVSSGLTGQNCQAQMAFISSLLVSNWTVSFGQIEAAPVVYDSQFLSDFGDFKLNNLNELRQAINAAQTFCGTADAPSITSGLSKASDPNGEVAPDHRPGVLGVTILFTSTSNSTDVANAMQYAAKLKTNGNTLIVIAIGPNANPTTLTPLASGSNFVFAESDYTALATNGLLSSHINEVLCIPGPGLTTPAATTPASTTIQTTPAASSSAPSTGSTCAPPTTPPNVYPCQANILILIDGSGGLNDSQFSQQNAFIINQLLNANWTYHQIAIGEFDSSDPQTFQALSPFNNLNNYDDAKGIFLGAYQLGDSPSSITLALQQANTLNSFTNAQSCVALRTILFTSTSSAADVASATPIAQQLTAKGNLIIVGMGPNVDNQALTGLASPNSFFAWSDYGTVPPTLASNIVQAFHC